jgi:plasmid replication initiation protein
MLQKERHPNLDFFVADFTTWTLKDDQTSMEHPFFSLAKNPDTTIHHYEHNGNTITIAPSVYGMPTIWDKDILIYCCSQLIEGIKQGREPKREVVFPIYNFLVSTNRSTGKRGYDLITKALQRLKGVQVTTNIRTNGILETNGFGFIGDWDAAFSLTDNRTLHVRIELSTWLYRAITNFEVLTLSRDYFRLDGGIERRIYELCRKHCGHQPTWTIGLDLLYKKSGSTSTKRLFRSSIKQLATSNHLPDYWLKFDPEEDQMTAYLRSNKGGFRMLKDAIRLR